MHFFWHFHGTLLTCYPISKYVECMHEQMLHRDLLLGWKSCIRDNFHLSHLASMYVLLNVSPILVGFGWLILCQTHHRLCKKKPIPFLDNWLGPPWLRIIGKREQRVREIFGFSRSKRIILGYYTISSDFVPLDMLCPFLCHFNFQLFFNGAVKRP